MRIAVHGASGFTGGLVAAELVRRGLTPVLVGRDGERLRRAAEEAAQPARVEGESAAGRGHDSAAGSAPGSGPGPTPEVRVAALDDHRSLVAALSGCAAVINCAGPFTRLGEPVVRAAVEAGVHYVDTTGEQGFLRRVFTEYAKPARDAGVTVVPAMTDDGLPGDLIAALTAARLPGPADTVLVADLRAPDGVPSRGTARSGAVVVGEPPLEYADGALRTARVAHPTTLAVPGAPGLPDTAVPLAPMALPGVVTVPRHVPARLVQGAIRAEVAALFSALTPEVAESLPEVLPAAARGASRWLMAVHATTARGARAVGWAAGPDVYGLTAVIAVEAATRLVTTPAPPGVLAAAEAFDPYAFLTTLAPHGVTWDVA